MRLPARLLHRKVDAHKGDFGHIFILAGSARFSGAVVLCSLSALRSGAGLVTLGVPASINNAVIKIKHPEVMTFPLPETKEGVLSFAAYGQVKDFSENVDVLAIGPGLSQHKSTQTLIRKIVSSIDRPMVIDADGLNALTGHLNLLRVSSCGLRVEKILTPHPGEMARLLGVSIKEAQRKRETLARKFAKDYKVTLVLKGHHTIVADYQGKFYLNNTGNPGMATAGSGDVLTGMIAAFLGQGLSAFDAAKFAVYLHGLAGDMAAKQNSQISLIASDIIAKIPAAIKKCG